VSVLPGNPDVLDSGVAGLRSTTSRIQRAVEDLRALALDSTAKSLDAIRAQSADVASKLDAVHGRYDGTTSALTEYSAVLRNAQRDADDGQDSLTRAEQGAADAEVGIYRERLRLRTLEDGNAPLGSISAAEQDLLRAQALYRAYDSAATSGQAKIDAARAQVEQAAQTAIARIVTALEDTNEGFWDGVWAGVEDFLAGTAAVLANIGRWITDFLADVWLELQRIVATVVAIVSTAIILTLVAAVVLALGLVIGGPIFGPGLGVLAASLFLTTASAFLIGSILSDVLKPAPVPEEYAPDESMLRKHGHQPGDLGAALDETTLVDGLGNSGPEGENKDFSGIRMTRIVDADGVVRWRIALPSTQEWLSRFGDQGATNDLDSNLALVMTPALRSQYERALLAAMAEAGVGPNDPVMLVGFSQGGIVAGHMAAYNNDYNWSAVVVAGAPIDHMPIPSSTSVVSVQHAGDPVHMLDSFVTVADGFGTHGLPNHGSNWTTIEAVSSGTSEGVGGIHNAERYSETLQNLVGRVPSGTQDELDQFFIGDDDAYGYEEMYYRWNE
jgi:predicted esterase